MGQEHGAPRISDKTKIDERYIRRGVAWRRKAYGWYSRDSGRGGNPQEVWDLCLAIYLMFCLLSVLFFFCFFPVYYDWRNRIQHGNTKVCNQTGLAPQAVNVENTGTEWRSKPGRDTRIAGWGGDNGGRSAFEEGGGASLETALFPLSFLVISLLFSSWGRLGCRRQGCLTAPHSFAGTEFWQVAG